MRQRMFLSEFTFSPLKLENEIPLPEDLCFVIASSGVKAEKTGAAKEKYNRLSLLVNEIREKFDNNLSLAQIIVEYGFEELSKKIENKDLNDRLQQFYRESFEIIPQVSAFLENNQIEKIGGLIDLSHENAGQFLKNQTVETNFLQSSARKLRAVAASAFEQGFGGSVYALVKKNSIHRVLRRMEANVSKVLS